MDYMERALSLARLALGQASPNPAVGALVVMNNVVVGEGYTQPPGYHHAEILAIQAAIKIQGTSRLESCDLWVTLEPCTMCAGAIAHARLRRLYFGARDEKAGAVESGVRFFDQPSCHHKPEVYGGMSEQAASALLRQFFQDRR